MKQNTYPIYAYGHPLLRKKSEPIQKGEDLSEVLHKMFETMKKANGIGLAAPQIGISKRLFVIDTTSFSESEKGISVPVSQVKKVFINPKIIQEEGEKWNYSEGCLSIPDIHEEVSRKKTVTLSYMNESFQQHTETYDGIVARVIQHEYDHIEGILFIDHISSIRKSLIKKKLDKIMKGRVEVDYSMIFVK